MKLLPDNCIDRRAAIHLRGVGYDVTYVREWPGDPGDEAILAVAFSEQRCLVTLDQDFAELVIVRGKSHAGLIRLIDIRGAEQGAATERVITHYEPDLQAAAIISVDPIRVRVRKEIS